MLAALRTKAALMLGRGNPCTMNAQVRPHQGLVQAAH